MEEDDSLIVSSRETSTIIKMEHIHGDMQLSWLAGDERFWEDTPYADYCLKQEGDFVPQYGTALCGNISGQARKPASMIWLCTITITGD